MHLRLLAPGAAAAALACLLAACAPAAGDTAGGLAGDGAAAQAAAGPGYNDADVRFAAEMIPHHVQTVELAQLAGTRAADPYVRTMAGDLLAKENQEIAKMKGWLRTWGVPLPSGTPHGGHAMPGMLTPGEVAMLGKATGAAFDRLWLRLIARHLEHGVEMAERVLAAGRHTPTTMLAGNLVTEQREKIAEIGGRLDGG